MAILPDFIDRYSCHFGKGAFEGCTKLKRVKIAACYIEEELFKDCCSLENIKITDNVDSWSLPHGIYGHAFYGCNSLKSIVLPSYFRWIGESAFEGCTQLEYIAKEEDKDNNLQKAFESFGAQLKQRVEQTLSYYSRPSKEESETFENSIRLSSEATLNDFRYVLKLEHSYLYQVHIQSKAFKGCNIKRIFLDEICLEGEENFAHCNSLNTVCLRYTRDRISDDQPKIIDYRGQEQPPKIDFSRTFEECSSLESIFIGFHTDHIEYKYVETGEHATSFEYHRPYLWHNGGKIEEISKNTFSKPGGVRPIFTQTFSGCRKLVSVYIEGGQIQDYAFADCINIEHLDFGCRIKFTGSYIFKNCRKISNFYRLLYVLNRFENSDWTKPINEATFAESNLKVKLRREQHGESFEWFDYLVYST